MTMKTKYIMLDSALDILHNEEVVMETPMTARRLISALLAVLPTEEIERDTAQMGALQ